MNVSHQISYVLFALAALIATVSPPLPMSSTVELAQDEQLRRNMLVMIQPELPREQPRFTGVCYDVHPQETLQMLVKGVPAIPQGGDILIVGLLGAGLEVGFPGNPNVFTDDGWSMIFQIPGALPQEELILVRNTSETGAPACFKLAYQFPLEPESEPEQKDGNEPSTRPM